MAKQSFIPAPISTHLSDAGQFRCRSEWRCHRCSKLLGIRRRDKLHILVHGHDYTVSFPAETLCRACGCFNRTTDERAR